MFHKRHLRAYAIPCVISIAAIALGGIAGIASKGDPAHPPSVYAAAGLGPDQILAFAGAADDVFDADVVAASQAQPTEVSKQRLAVKPPEEPRNDDESDAGAPANAAAEAQPSGEAPEASAAEAEANAAPVSLFDENQMVVYYGTPLAPGLGVLGTMPPQEMAQRLQDHSGLYDDLNGDRGVIPTMDLIYGVVQSEPTANGLYLSYLPDDRVNEYIRLAEEHDLQLILDLQIGRSTVAAEIEKIERFLLHPRVHVAIDPEYAVGPNGVPIHTPGVISGHDINGAQLYLQELTEEHNLPPKMLVVHQFMDGTIIEGEVTADLPNVDVVLNMDAFGDYPEKVKKYAHYMARPYAERRSFNIFLKQDRPVGTEHDVLALDPMPDMVMYQ